MTMLIDIIILLMINSCICTSNKRGLFLIGDSTSAKLYHFGLSLYYNCSIEDTSAVLKLENVNIYKFKGLLCCNDKNVSKIGYMFHWGVSDKDYYVGQWNTHRFEGDTTNSRSNILLAVNEFKMRSAVANLGMDIIFLSNYWDSVRIQSFVEQKNCKLNDMINDFHSNYTSILHSIQSLLNTNDRIFLQTAHICHAIFRHYVTFLNIEIIKIAYENNMQVFRSDIILGPHLQMYLEQDQVHQSHQFNIILALELDKLLYSNNILK